MNDNIIKIAFSGDILSYECQDKLLRVGKNKYDYNRYFDLIQSIFEKSNYVVGSFETVCAGVSAKYTSADTCFNTPDEILNSLKQVGFNLLTTANNHCLDRGINGLYRTIDVMDSIGMEHTGTFKNPTNDRYIIKNIGGLKIAFLAYTYGTNSKSNQYLLSDDELYMVNLTRKQDAPVKKSLLKKIVVRIYKELPKGIQLKIRPTKSYQIVKDCVAENEIDSDRNEMYISEMISCIKEAKEKSDFLFFCLHSGGQFNSEVGLYTKWLVDKIAKAGADIIIGNHAHTILPFKVLNESTAVIYSLGNFSFTPGVGYYVDNVYADYSAILNVYINKTIKKIDKITCSILRCIIGDDGISKVIPVYDLYQKLDVDIKKQQIFQDYKQVIHRMCGIPFDKISMTPEFVLIKYTNDK